MTDPIIRVSKLNEVYLKITLSRSQAMELKGHLECYTPNYQFHPRYKARIWDGRVSFFDVQRSLLPTGLLPDFVNYCQKFGYEYVFDFDVNEFSSDIPDEHLKLFYDTLFSGSDLYPRDYQQKAIGKSLRNKRGVVVSPTGSGKSLILYSIIRFLIAMDLKILLVVPNTSLVEQMFSDFKSYGWDDLYSHVSILYSGKNPDFKKPVLISTWQSLQKKKEDFFSAFDGVLVDEVHGAKAYSIQVICKKCVNAQYRLGFTGTLQTEKSDLYSIYGYLGRKIFDLKSGELIERGVLSTIKIANIICKYPTDVIVKNKRRPYEEEVQTIMNYTPRNKVFRYIFNNIPDKQNTLVLCTRIEHLNELKTYFEQVLDKKYKVFVIYGAIKAEERERIRGLMEKSDNVILLGTFATMATGINIKKIHNIVFGSSYKSKIRVIQACGRGLRRHDSKDGLVLFDVVDDLTWRKKSGEIGKNHVYLHFEERLKYYDEQGFKYSSMVFPI